MDLVKDRRVYWFNKLRAEGYGRREARNGMRATIRFWDAINAKAIDQFIADCAVDGIECFRESAASILEERWFLAQSVPNSH